MKKRFDVEGQISLFEVPAEVIREPRIGDYVKAHGAVIPHIMRQAFIGKKVVICRSTQSHDWFCVGILEDYIPYEGNYRAIVNTGLKQRSLITFYPGINIYELESGGNRWQSN